jgi:xanthine/uracil permease
MAIVATFWLPSLDPVGSASVLAAIAAAVCWVLVELPALRRFQTQVIVGAAILFIGFMLVSSAPIIVHAPLYGFLMKVRRFPNLDDYLGNWIVMAVGLVLSLKLQRREHRGSVGLAVLFGLLIAGELAGQLYWRYAG